jgi:putative methylase
MMDMITKKKQLEILLQSIPVNPIPKANLEQYSTPATIAADVLWNAYAGGDIEGMKVVDLGCGTGVFAIGAALLGAGEAVGVDVDAGAVDLAGSQASKMGLNGKTRFISRDVQDFHEKGDTVIQNPPFGAQKAHRKEADRIFMTKALEIAPVIYSFHLMETQDFVEKFFQSKGGNITQRFYYRFPIPRIYDFHEKEKIEVDVVVFRVEIIN